MKQHQKKLVIIEWLDSSTFGGIWNDISEIVDQTHSLLCRSVGWVLLDNKDFIVLVSHLTGKQASGDMTIPKKAILKTTVLKKK